MHKYTAKIVLAHYKNSRQQRQVALQCFINHKKVQIGLGFYVSNAAFDPDKQRVKLSDKKMEAMYNSLIETALHRAREIQINAKLYNIPLTADTFARNYYQENVNHNFIQYCTNLVESERHVVVERTTEHHLLVIRYMTEFRPVWTMADVTYTTIKEFHLWLRKNPKEYETNYIAKLEKSIRKFVNAAIKDKMPIENPFDTFKIKTQKTNTVHLDEHELQRFINLYANEAIVGRDREVLSAFIFSATSGGLRLSDIKALTEKNFVNNELIFVPQKTTKSKVTDIRFELTTLAQTMMASRAIKKFDLPADQQVNKKLKSLAAIAGIEKKLTFHVARNTFSIQYITKGGTAERLQKILGHANLSETMNYARIGDKTVSESMRIMNEYQLPPPPTV